MYSRICILRELLLPCIKDTITAKLEVEDGDEFLINLLEINVREYRKGNHKWTIQRNRQHRVHKTTNNKIKLQHNTICVGDHYTQTNTNNVDKT